MSELSFLGPDCGCDCNPVPPVTDYFRYRAGAAWIAKGGVPAFRGFSRGLLIRQVIQKLSDLAAFSNWVVLVINDGVNNGCWQTVAGAWVRKVGFESAAGVTSTAFFPGDNLTNSPWFAEGDSFATLVFDQGAQAPLSNLTGSGGSYGSMFARYAWAWQASGAAAGQARFEMNREPLMETFAASGQFLSYMQAYGFLKGMGVQEFDGANLGNIFEAYVDGAQTTPTARLIPLYGWVPGGANTVVSRVRYRAGIGFVPKNFQAGEFCRDTTATTDYGGGYYVCISDVDTVTGSGSGSADRPGLDEAHWKPSMFDRGMPWDARGAEYESRGTFTIKAVPRKRFLRVVERTDATLLDGGGAQVDSTWGEREWTFPKWDGPDRDHWNYRQSGYVPCANMLGGALDARGRPDVSTRAAGAMVEFPAVPFRGSGVELLETSARDNFWSIRFKTFVSGGSLVVTQSVTLSEEVSNEEMEGEVIARANGLYAAIVGYGSQQERRGTDGTIYYEPGPDGAPAGGGVPPAPARPFIPYQVSFLQRPFTGEFNDAFFFAQHYRVEACKQAYHMPADETQCLSLAEGEYVLGVRTGSWYKFDCGRAGELVFERAPDPGSIRAYDYGEGFAPC